MTKDVHNKSRLLCLPGPILVIDVKNCCPDGISSGGVHHLDAPGHQMLSQVQRRRVFDGSEHYFCIGCPHAVPLFGHDLLEILYGFAKELFFVSLVD